MRITTWSLRARRESQTLLVHQPVREEEVGQDGGQLERPVALDAVARALDADDRGRGLAAQELGDVGVVDDRPGQAAHEQQRDREPRDGLPQVAELGTAPGRRSVRKRA